MARIIETTVYKFAELSEDAKERARDWWRGCIESDELANYDDWESIATILGISFATRSVQLMGGGSRQDPLISWSVGGCQGDGARFNGHYEYSKQAGKRIRAYAPNDTELHRIADALQRVQAGQFYQLVATMSEGTGSNFYSHSGTMAVDVDRKDGADADLCDASEKLTQLMRDFADWIHGQLVAQWEYLHSAESVDESILANDYEFTESGDIA